jgi:hypothetical protein
VLSILDICLSTDNIDRVIAQAVNRCFSPTRVGLSLREVRFGFMGLNLVQDFPQVFLILFCTDTPHLSIITHDVSDGPIRQHVVTTSVMD